MYCWEIAEEYVSRNIQNVLFFIMINLYTYIYIQIYIFEYLYIYIFEFNNILDIFLIFKEFQMNKVQNFE